MLPITAKLNTAVSDMTTQGKARLFENYFTKGFTAETFSIKLWLDDNTFKMFTLEVVLIEKAFSSPQGIGYVLFADNGSYGSEILMQGKLAITQNMTVLAGLLCALHINGDYLKFAFNPTSEKEV